MSEKPGFITYLSRISECEKPFCTLRSCSLSDMQIKYADICSVLVRQGRGERVETLRSRLTAALAEQYIQHGKHVLLQFREVVGGRSVVSCERCFQALHACEGDASKEIGMYCGSSIWRKFKTILKAVQSLPGGRENSLAKGGAATTTRQKSAEYVRFKNVIQARRFFARCGLAVDEFGILASCLPDKPVYIEVLHFLLEWFELSGDKPPVKECYVELNNMYTHDLIYGIFRRTVSLHKGEEHQPASYEDFMNVWKTCFPNVHIVKFLAVNGKCETCANIADREQRFKTKKDLEDINDLKFLHRQSIAETRAFYYKNRLLAHLRPDMYVSWIFDGMQQSHCSLPYRGNNKVYAATTTQHIQGVKCHGRWRKFFRTFEHVETGADLACHVWLIEVVDLIDHCQATGEVMPKVCFLQIDGGSENTNKTLLALAELVVKLGVFQEVHINRLLVGHTRIHCLLAHGCLLIMVRKGINSSNDHLGLGRGFQIALITHCTVLRKI